MLQIMNPIVNFGSGCVTDYDSNKVNFCSGCVTDYDSNKVNLVLDMLQIMISIKLTWFWICYRLWFE